MTAGGYLEDIINRLEDSLTSIDQESINRMDERTSSTYIKALDIIESLKDIINDEKYDTAGKILEQKEKISRQEDIIKELKQQISTKKSEIDNLKKTIRDLENSPTERIRRNINSAAAKKKRQNKAKDAAFRHWADAANFTLNSSDRNNCPFCDKIGTSTTIKHHIQNDHQEQINKNKREKTLCPSCKAPLLKINLPRHRKKCPKINHKEQQSKTKSNTPSTD